MVLNNNMVHHTKGSGSINKEREITLKLDALESEMSKLKLSNSYKLGCLISDESKTIKQLILLPYKILKFIYKVKFSNRKLLVPRKQKFSTVDSNTAYLKETDQSVQNNLIDGISVIIPVFKGQSYISTCLQSLSQQSLYRALFEVVFIINGEKDQTEESIKSFMDTHKDMSVLVSNIEIANVCAARNIGIEKASRKYSVFVDVDDELTENYLENLYSQAAANSIVFSNIFDIVENQRIKSSLSKKAILSTQSNNLNYSDVTSLITMNACKLIPTSYLKEIEYKVDLKSGEDVVYFTELVAKFKPQIKLCTDYSETVYLRHVINDSISRKAITFDFNVLQRLDVIKYLDKILMASTDELVTSFTESKIIAQLNFISAYLNSNISQYSLLIGAVKDRQISFDVCKRIAEQISTSLVISYCFPPYADTSAVVMAKRVRDYGFPIDVIYNKMDRVRDKDANLNELIETYIGNVKEVTTFTSFSNWMAIERFCNSAEKQVQEWQSFGKNYQTVHSRSMWPASHFAAALIKIRNPELKWTAEFSDPLYLDIHGQPRKGDINKSWLENNGFIALFSELNIKIPNTKELFFWCEYLPYILANELLFTNENQFQYMCSYLNDKELIKLIESKAVISNHPEPIASDYDLQTFEYNFDKTKINLCYFGTFYATRGLNEVFESIRKLTSQERSKLAVHIFTNEQTRAFIDDQLLDLEDVIIVNSYVSYFEFLNICKSADCLIVRDAETKGSKIINPYLPSKLSDYLGSDSNIWAICEDGSVMSQKSKADTRISYSTELFDIDSATNVLRNLIERVN